MSAQQTSPPKAIKDLRLPISRVKTIMKSSPQVEAIGQDCLFLVAKATELFVHYLSEEAHKKSNKASSLEYKHLAEVVQTNDTLEFLREIMPRKITVRQFKEMMAAKNSSDDSSDSDSDSQSDSESNTDSDEKVENGNSSDESDKKNGNDDSSENSKSESEEDSKT